ECQVGVAVLGQPLAGGLPVRRATGTITLAGLGRQIAFERVAGGVAVNGYRVLLARLEHRPITETVASTPVRGPRADRISLHAGDRLAGAAGDRVHGVLDSRLTRVLSTVLVGVDPLQVTHTDRGQDHSGITSRVNALGGGDVAVVVTS